MDVSRKRKQYRVGGIELRGERNMRALRAGRGLTPRNRRTAVVLIGLLAAAAVIVALPTAAGADRHAFRDVHNTKAFWSTASLHRAAHAQQDQTLIQRLTEIADGMPHGSLGLLP